MNRDGTTLDSGAVLAALAELSAQLQSRNIVGELCWYGGRVMVLGFSDRLSAREVEAIFRPTCAVRAAVEGIAVARQWRAGWLNERVGSLLAQRSGLGEWNLPQFSHLRILRPAPQYVLAMKCLASSLSGDSGDREDSEDIAFLIRCLGIQSAKEALELVAQYHPANRIPVPANQLVEGLFKAGRI